VQNLQESENARKNKVEFARKENCKKWNLEEKIKSVKSGICKKTVLQVKVVCSEIVN